MQLSILLVLVTAHDGFYDGLAIASAALAFVAALSMIPLSHQEHSKTPRPSMLLSSFLFLTLLFDIVQTRTLWLAVDPPRDSIIARLFTTSLAVKAVVLLIEARRKARWLTWNPEEHSPEETSGLFSLGVFSWLNKLFLNGYKKILGIDDLYALDKAMATERTAARISDSVFRGKPGHNKHALAVVMVRALVTPLLLPIAPRIALIGFNFCQPFFINALLDYLQGSSSPNIGHGLIGASALTYTGIAISTAFYWYYTKRVLYMVRGVLVSAIYKKTTVVRASTAGDAEAITLMSTDVERIMQGLHNMHEFWANIIEAALGCWLLQRQLGLAFMAPVVVILVCLGCVSYLGTLSGSRQREWMDSIQRRVGLTAEILPSMKHLHIAGIAAPVSKFIQGLRIDEINSGNRFRILFVVTAVIAYTPGSISPVMAYAVTSANLDVSTIYTSLSYILLATKPLAGLFQAVPTMIAAFTCLNRIQRYLEAEEQAGLSGAGASYPEDVVQEKQAYEPVGDALPENTPETEKDFALDDGSATQEQGLATPATLRIVDGSFGWTPELYALSGINITVPSAKLTMIVGPVASGKSTLCKALLGEVPFSSGRVLRSAHRTIAYCEQTPFLSNTTVKENIVGFAQFSQERYDEVIEATMLSIDMTQLPSGHGTRIGSSGIMLSGGQKQRVALARALYAPAQLLIFDDILSGLDDDTAAEIFRRVFGPDGLLRRRDATAVLCTHSVRHLPAADHIIALTNGIVVEEGTFDDLMANRKYVHSLNIQPSDSDSGSENDSPAQEDTTGAGSRQARDDEEIAAAMDDRTRQTGDWRVYKHYFSRVKLISLITFFVCTVLYGTCRNLPTVWMNYWAGDLLHRSTAFYIGIYTLLSTMQLVFMFGLVAIVMSSFISSSGAELHAETLRTVVSAPLRFFTTTDIGVVTNLFSQDMTLIDSELPLALANFTAMSVDSLGMAAVIAVASPYVAVSYPVLFLMLYAVQKFYLRTSRQMRLLDLEAKSPL